MKLNEHYNEVIKRIDKLNFNALWKGFKPLKFALYNDKECYFDGHYIPKTNQFLANTSILFEDSYIAIWNVMEDTIDYDVLTSKIVHEMFHGYQYTNNESRFPNEIEVLQNYCYSSNNLSLKWKENQLINELINLFNRDTFIKLLQIRKRRSKEFSYEFSYESAIEQIEGTANFVEMEVLKSLSFDTYQKALKSMQESIINKKRLIPIRVISYSIGALMTKILKDNQLMDYEFFDSDTISHRLINNIEPFDSPIMIDEQIEEAITMYTDQTINMVNSSIKANQCVLNGEYVLMGVNVYNARFWNNYIVSTYFVAYESNGKNEILYGDYVVHLNNHGKVDSCYRLIL